MSNLYKLFNTTRFESMKKGEEMSLNESEEGYDVKLGLIIIIILTHNHPYLRMIDTNARTTMNTVPYCTRVFQVLL